MKHNLIILACLLLALSLIVAIFIQLRRKKNRYKVEYYINYLLYKLGIRKTIARFYIARQHALDCNESLVELVKHPKILYNEATLEFPVLLRKTVAKKIYKVADSLPEGVFLKIYEATRSRILIYNEWKNEEERLIKEFPQMGRAELLAKVNTKICNPKIAMNGHDTGGAVDVALCDAEGNDFDFGTKYHEKNTNVPLTEEQKKNRMMLCDCMKTQKFINNPNRWWHFSYGDKAWAAYSGKYQGAFYGAVEKEFDNIGFVRVVKTEIKTDNIK